MDAAKVVVEVCIRRGLSLGHDRECTEHQCTGREFLTRWKIAGTDPPDGPQAVCKKQGFKINFTDMHIGGAGAPLLRLLAHGPREISAPKLGSTSKSMFSIAASVRCFADLHCWITRRHCHTGLRPAAAWVLAGVIVVARIA